MPTTPWLATEKSLDILARNVSSCLRKKRPRHKSTWCPAPSWKQRVCRWEMLVRLSEKVCRKSSEIRKMFWEEGNVELNGPKDTASQRKQKSESLFIPSFNVQVKNLLFTRHCTRAKVTRWIRHSPQNLGTGMLEKNWVGVGKRSKMEKNLKENLGLAKGTLGIILHRSHCGTNFKSCTVYRKNETQNTTFGTT